MYNVDFQQFRIFAQAKVLFCSSKIIYYYKSNAYDFAQAKIICSSKILQTTGNQCFNFCVLLKQIFAKKFCSSKSLQIIDNQHSNFCVLLKQNSVIVIRGYIYYIIYKYRYI